jgi:hypothetical protein
MERTSATAVEGFGQPAGWRAFRDPAVEATYRSWHRAQILPVARVIAVGSGMIWIVIPVLFYLYLWADAGM